MPPVDHAMQPLHACPDPASAYGPLAVCPDGSIGVAAAVLWSVAVLAVLTVAGLAAWLLARRLRRM